MPRMNSKSSRNPLRNFVVVALLLTFCLGSGESTRAQSDSSREPKTTAVTAGQQYAAPPSGTAFILGTDYRELWTTPIEVEGLNLKTFAGGLKPVMRVGGLETLGLALRGQDARDYTFRSVDKFYSDKVISAAFRNTLVEGVIQDQIAANFPGVQVVTGPIEKAAGVLAPEDSRLVVMPEDSALGEFQEDFAGDWESLCCIPSLCPTPTPVFMVQLRFSATRSSRICAKPAQRRSLTLTHS